MSDRDPDSEAPDSETPDSEADGEAEDGGEKMPLLAHLAELRRRLIYALGGFIVAFFVCFAFADFFFNFLIAPLADLWQGQSGRRLIFTALHERFFTNIKIAFFVALFFSFPIISNQIWIFVAPGLYKKEKSVFLPFLIATPILFLLGAAFVYYFVMPVAWRFFAGFEQAAGPATLAIQLEPKVNEYLSLSMRLIMAFGISFELPVILILLVRTGVITTGWLASKRRYAIVLAFVTAAILTPPDPVSQITLAIPIILLYELSIWAARFQERRRRQNATAT